jgi:Na/Pi-cotransporter
LAKTNADGIADTSITVGSGTGKYEVNVEVATSATTTRGIPVKQLGINIFALCMNVFGGLAIFVLGMKLMSEGLTKVAGEKMRSLLHMFSKNKSVAVVAGALVTAVVQSSSATTVMVIGFINAGLLNLTQSLGIIFGANIGTTITAQVIAFDISSITMPAIIIGMVMTFIAVKVLRGWGEAILGFGLLFFGMGLMSAELKGIAQFPSFMEIFRVFDCAPINGVMPIGAVLGALGIGILVTIVIQSSSAATGIILALGASGLINFYTAVILVLGSNIGTTVTAQLAALAANRIAKQAALAHTIFNCIGVMLVLLSFFFVSGEGSERAPVFFHLINSLTSGNALGEIPQNLPRHIANAHTVFNVATTVILIPFIGLLAKLCERIIRVKKDEEVKYQYLEPHLLDNPLIALEQATKSYSSMLQEAWDMIESSTMEHFVNNNFDEEVAASFDAREREVDKHQFEITNYLTQITRRPLSQKQAEYIPVLMHCTNDAERIADYTSNIISLASRLKEAEASISEAGIEDLKFLFDCLRKQANLLMRSISEHNVDAAYEARAMEKEFTRLSNELEDKHIERLREGTCRVIVGVIFIELLGELEKVSAKLATIAKRAPKIQGYFESVLGANK